MLSQLSHRDEWYDTSFLIEMRVRAELFAIDAEQRRAGRSGSPIGNVASFVEFR